VGPRSLSLSARRRTAAFVIALLALTAFGLPQPAVADPGGPALGPTVASEVRQPRAALARSSSDDVASAQSADAVSALAWSSPDEWLVSAPVEAGQLFGHIGVHWTRYEGGAPPPSDAPTEDEAHVDGDVTQWDIEVRTSTDGREWSQWYEAPADHDMDDEERSEHYAQPIPVEPSRLAQYRVRESATDIADVALTFMDVSDLNAAPDPVASILADVAAAWRRATTPLAASAAVTVAVRSRSTWGADPGILRAAPRYSPWKKAIVHHTVTTNSYSDAAAQLRSIYYYHSVTRRWGDIGYTYLVDKWGNVWQGRAGGEDSVGAHASGWNTGTMGVSTLGDFSSARPTATMTDSVAKLIAAKLGARRIQPMGADTFTHHEQTRTGAWVPVTSKVPNVLGHRDAVDKVGARGAATACPGTRLYALLETVRRTAQALVSGTTWAAAPAVKPVPAAAGEQLGVKWVSDKTPWGLGAVPVTVPLTIKNTGQLPWIQGLVNVAYHWYDDRGKLAVWDGARTPLPADIAPGKEARLEVRVLPPPRSGRFKLVYDLVWEGQWWFSSLDEETLVRRVTRR